jgi:hypothetical protein
MTTCAARRTSASRASRNGRVVAGARVWKSSSVPCQRPQRRARSNAGSAVSFMTIGVRESLDPSAERPSIPVE